LSCPAGRSGSWSRGPECRRASSTGWDRATLPLCQAWSTFGPQPLGAERFATVARGTSFAQVTGAILGKQARVQNPDKEEGAGSSPARPTAPTLTCRNARRSDLSVAPLSWVAWAQRSYNASVRADSAVATPRRGAQSAGGVVVAPSAVDGARGVVIFRSTRTLDEYSRAQQTRLCQFIRASRPRTTSPAANMTRKTTRSQMNSITDSRIPLYCQ
jgi:hypothetical protein